MQLDLFSGNYPDFTEFGDTPCSETFPDAFFPSDPPAGIMKSFAAYPFEREAKMICIQCPYQARCLEYALKDPDMQGIWGGTTEKQRKAMRRGQIVSLGLPRSRQ